MVNEVRERMINNDYIRGYFDAHGYIYSTKRQRGSPRWRIVFQDQDKSQMGKVHVFLTSKGYHPCSYPHRNNGAFGSRTRQQIRIERKAEIERFIEEIGTERPKLQERFNQFLYQKDIKELIECRRDARGDQGERLELVPLPCAALGIIGQVASRFPINDEINSS